MRNYNEDRVSVIVNVKAKSNLNIKWPQINYFGLYDGHGGQKCVDFIKNNLHKIIFQSKYFPYDIKKALLEGCYKADNLFLEQALS